MTLYYRPLAQTDAARPAGALPLAGHAQIWFDRVEVLSRDVVPAIKPVIKPVGDIPQNMRLKLSQPRAAMMGLSFAQPVLLGVLNTTPDSFSDGGQFLDLGQATQRARDMVAKGADMLDIGGESTRPGAALVAVDEELSRTLPVIKALRGAGMAVPISIDTRKSEVAFEAIQAGAHCINDVSALSFDAQMADTVHKTGAPVCLMHAQGDPATMQENPNYGNVLLDVYDHLQARIDVALAAGIARDQIILDPGIGFGKTAAHNLALIRGISLFHGLGCPLLLGVSRKKFIGTIGGATQAADRAPGSVAVALNALSQGVQIIRAHDIEAHAQAFALWRAMLTPE